MASGVREELGVDPDAFRTWTAEAQERALDLLKTRAESTWRPFYCPIPDCTGFPHDDWSWNHARADQRPPAFSDDWFCWLLKGGRGGGKTRGGSELVHRVTKIAPRIALIAPTGPDGRDIMVEGESGLLATARPGEYPAWEPSKKRLTWPNGALGTVFSGEEPDRLRGPQHYFAWIDEPAHMPLIQEVWDMLLLGLRLGRYPRVVASTTPTPIRWMKDLVADPLTRVSNFTTYSNLANLAEPFKRTILSRYEGTRMGRQELHGEILEDVEGALWTWDLIEGNRVTAAPPMDRLVVGIDPAGGVRPANSATGILVVGMAEEEFYVLDDLSGHMTPNRWATAALNAYDHHEADALVPETNFGGDMVTTTLRNIDAFPRIKPVHSRRGKAIRAEPVHALYERGKVHHVGFFPDLEEQLTSWVPGTGSSPDRLDALVHAITDLAKGSMPAAVASPLQLRHLSVVR